MIGDMQREITVLWVEDVPSSIRANVWKLQREGFKVDTKLSLRSAKDALKCYSYDLIFIDYSLPQNDGGIVSTRDALGLKLIEAIRGSKSFSTKPNVKIVLCTAQRESIGGNRERLVEFEVDVIPKTSSYFSVLKLAQEMKESSNV
jgi:CheY-like chemotaxis protein